MLENSSFVFAYTTMADVCINMMCVSSLTLRLRPSIFHNIPLLVKTIQLRRKEAGQGLPMVASSAKLPKWRRVASEAATQNEHRGHIGAR